MFFIIRTLLLFSFILQVVPNDLNITQLGQIKISQYVRNIVEHYKQKDPVGLPIQEIPDPLTVDEMVTSLPSVEKLLLKQIKIHGLSKFKVDKVIIDVSKMRANLAISVDLVNMYGSYSMTSLFSSSNGPFTIQATGVKATAGARLEVNEEGVLEAQEITMDFGFKGVDIKFHNTGIFFGFVQQVVNSMPHAIFESAKPHISSQFQTVVRAEVNKQTKNMPIKFPNSISPIDQVIAEIRRALRDRGCDPFKVNNYNQTIGLMAVQMMETWITGITSIHRVGNINVQMQNNTIYVNFQIGTQKVQGSSHWDVGFIGGILGRTGTIVFTIDYIKIELGMKQSMDTRNKPELKDLEIELGNIQVRFDGAGTFDYLIEFGVNILPNILRYQIMDALEGPIKTRVQEQLNMIDVEKVLIENAEKFDNGDFNELITEAGSSNVCPLSKIGL
nr:uncharacterized protein LOC111414229 [Onthophagus taurus]